ncbi:MAG TPA: hypothetical protein PLQ36_03695, partial [Candidatus Gracilibacteria bacterium]|nr:hypothetical protein [Candidatus Gracilibacteria bacterium]
MDKILYYFNLLLNVSKHEWPRIILAWLLKFLGQSVQIMLNTLIIALFVEKYQIHNLPFLYIGSASMAVIGALVASLWFSKMRKANVIFLLGGLISILIFGSPYFYPYPFYFFLFLVFINSVLINQLNIVISLFIEHLFSPLESQRTFPVIESADPLGGIFGGVSLALLVTIAHLSVLEIFTYTAGISALIIPILGLFFDFAHPVPKLESQADIEHLKENSFLKMRRGWRHIKGMNFLRYLSLIVFLHFAFVNLLEFQYTSVLDHHISSSEGHANALTEGLAFWHILFSTLAFFTQIFSSSRIQSRLGIIKTMRSHPLINIFAVIGTIPLSFMSGVMARGVFEISGMIHRTAYHAAFYVFKEKIRDQIKEFMEGIIRPCGIILGTVFLYLITTNLHPELQNLFISGIMLIIMISMYFLLWKMQGQYTQIAKKNLSAQSHHIDKIEAIEI